MPTLLGKMAGFVSSMMPGRESQTEAAIVANQHPAVNDDDDDLAPLPSIVRDYRAYLVRAIFAGEETEEIIQKLIELECPKLEDKYYAVRARDLIHFNNKSFQDLKNIHSGLGYIVKYAKQLFKDPDKRRDQWRTIAFKNNIYQKKIKPLQGSEKLLMQLGYIERTENCLRFPQGQEPEKEKIVNLIADMMLFKKELKEYILGKHPYPQHIEQMLPQQTRDEVLAFRLSGLKIDDENVDAASGQSLTVDFNSSATITLQAPNHVQTCSSSPLTSEYNNANNNVVEPKLTEESEATQITEHVTLASPQPTHGPAETVAAAVDNHEEIQAIQDLVSSQEEVADVVPLRSEDGSSSSTKRYSCSVCGEDAILFCTGCSNKMLCENCNVNWHKHPTRSQHPQMHRAESVSALISITPDSSLQLVFDATYGIHQTNNARLSKKQQTYVMDQKRKIKKPERDQLYGNVPDLASLGQDINAGNSHPANRPPLRNQQPNDYQILDYQRQQIYPPYVPLPNVLSTKSMSHYMNYGNENVIGHGLPQGAPLQQLHRPSQPIPQHLLESPEGLPPYLVQQLREQQKRNMIGPFPQQPGPTTYVHNQTYSQSQPMNELGPNTSYTNGPSSMYQSPLPNASLQKHSSNIYYGMAHSPYRPSSPHLAAAPMHASHNQDLNMYGEFNNPALHAPHSNAAYGPQMARPYTGNNPGIRSSVVASSGYYAEYQDNKLTPSTKCIQRLLQEPDLHKRKFKCENYIEDYEMDLRDLEKEFNNRLLEIEEFSESEACRDMNKRKAALLKEKRNLEMFRNDMDTEPQKAPAATHLSHYKEDDQQIYYPPEIEKASLRPSRLQTPPSNYGQTAIQKTVTDGLKPANHSQGDPGVYNRNINNTGSLQGTVIFPTAREEDRKTGSSQQYKNSKSNTNQGISRVPVESSSSVDDNFDIIHLPPPDIPPRPRPGSEENILNKIIHPSKQSGMFHPKQWQCEHCTYINKPTAHACSMCHKTSTNPELISDNFDEDHINEVDQNHEQDEDISQEISLKDDALLQMLTEGQDESFVSSDPEETQVFGANINGSQIQVMLEKKRAQEEYQQRMNRQIISSPLLTASRSESQSPTLAAKHVCGVGACAKQTNNPKPDLTTGEVSLSGSYEYHTPPSGQSPPLSTPPKGPPSSVTKLKESGTEKGGRMSSLEDAIARYNEQKLIETLQVEGAKLSKLIKKADQEGFEVEAVQVALTFCEHQNVGPLEWLRSNWNRNVEKVKTMATAIGNRQQCNSIGELTISEAQSAYISCHGNMKEAAQLCADRRIKLFEYLSQLGDFPREEVLQTMHQCQGNQEESEYQLLQSNLQHFLDHIWAQKDSGQSNRFAFPDITSSDVCHSLSTSVIAHSDFQKMIKNKSIPTDRRIRLILVEGCLKSWGRAELVIKILDNDLPGEDIALEDVVEAVRNCLDRQSAIAYLQQECAVCITKFPMSKIRSLNFCQCKICEQCLACNFEVVIREKHVRHWTCPLCSLPDLTDTEIASDYLHFLTLLLQPLISQELQNLFETKVRDWHLQKDPNFRWCAHCAEGFLAENRGHQLRLTCPHCGEKTCFSCKKEWEDQHEGLTCEQYAQWKIDNDPNNQSVGLAKHLDENGIDCPMCKMRFALAKGGCMHFKCPQCGHEFCSGCNEPYHHKEVCNKYKTCKNLGLHCHCPRDCFSYMRDYSVTQLQGLLKQHKVPFNVKTPDDQSDSKHCPVMEQKEFDLVKKDEKCGKESVDGQAGLCEIHYKEYLVDIINRHKLDPLSLMTKDAMIVLIRRYDLAVPNQKVGESPEAYLASLTKVIKEKLPLRRS